MAERIPKGLRKFETLLQMHNTASKQSVLNPHSEDSELLQSYSSRNSLVFANKVEPKAFPKSYFIQSAFVSFNNAQLFI